MLLIFFVWIGGFCLFCNCSMNCSMMLKNSLIFLRLEIVYSRLWRIVPQNSYFSTHTQTALGAQGYGPYWLFAITIGHVSAIPKHIYSILCLEKRPHTQHPEQKNAKWFLIYRFALLGMFFSWVASVSQLLNDMFAQNIGKMPRSPSPSRFSHYQILHAISSSTNHRENVTWPYFLPAMSWLLVGGLLEWSLPIRPRFCETRWTHVSNFDLFMYLYVIVIIVPVFHLTKAKSIQQSDVHPWKYGCASSQWHFSCHPLSYAIAVEVYWWFNFRRYALYLLRF